MELDLPDVAILGHRLTTGREAWEDKDESKMPANETCRFKNGRH